MRWLHCWFFFQPLIKVIAASESIWPSSSPFVQAIFRVSRNCICRVKGPFVMILLILHPTAFTDQTNFVQRWCAIVISPSPPFSPPLPLKQTSLYIFMQSSKVVLSYVMLFAQYLLSALSKVATRYLPKHVLVELDDSSSNTSNVVVCSRLDRWSLWWVPKFWFIFFWRRGVL